MDLKYYKSHYCSDIENVENFEKAKVDNFKGWECHHRLETHTPDGKRRDADISHKELIALGLYYHRPSEELIFLTTREHHAFKKGKQAGENNPMYGKHHTKEARNKMREAKKGKSLSEETRKKMSESRKGKPKTEEWRKKLGEAHKGNTATKGMHWFNNSKINKLCYECPEGFTPGRLRK